MKKKSEIQAQLENLASSEKKWIYQGKILSLFLETLHLENGKEVLREYVDHKQAVALIPVADNGEIFLIQQYRKAANKILLEIPAGLIEENENPEMCAQRELQEEIGYRSDQMTFLGRYFTSPGFCNETVSLFLAEKLTESPLIGDDDEAIDIVSFSADKILPLIHNKEIEDLKTITALLFYLQLKGVKDETFC